MKLYSIEYSHLTGFRSKQTDSIIQLSEWLETALNDEYVTDETIVLTTQIRKA